MNIDYKNVFMHNKNKGVKHEPVKIRIAPSAKIDGEPIIWINVTSGILNAGFHSPLHDVEKLRDALTEIIEEIKEKNNEKGMDSNFTCDNVCNADI